MARGRANTAKDQSSFTEPRSLGIAKRGVKSSDDFANLMSALMSDLIEGKVAASVGNATCNAGGKLLKMVDMTYKNGNPGGQTSPRKTLTIAFEEPSLKLASESEHSGDKTKA